MTLHNLFGDGGRGGHPSRINVNVEQFPDVECIHCKNTEFRQSIILRIIPALYSPTGHPGQAQLASLCCVKCGWKFTLEEYEKHQKQELIQETRGKE